MARQRHLIKYVYNSTPLFALLLILATLLCALVAGLLFSFAVVTMPGIRRLSDREFIRAFQVMDDVIQKNQPIFMLVWLGSAPLMLVATVWGYSQLDAVGRGLIVVAAALYILGVQVPTALINVPLNNKLQTLDVDTMDESAQTAARRDFEPRWNRWNRIRTIVATIVTTLLLFLLFLI